MNNIKILLLDDDTNDIFKVRNAIKSCNKTFPNLSNGKEIEISEFDFSKHFSTDSVKSNILSLIDKNDYSSIVIDQRIMLENGYVDGNAVFEFIKNAIPCFPVVMLTQLPEHCRENGVVDFDKIYEKKEFLKSDSELVKKLICNAEQYLKNINDIDIELRQLSEVDTDNFQRYIELETMLCNYLPKYYTKKITESFSKEYKELLSLINRLEKHINEK